METVWTTLGDFGSVVDGLEPVILRRRGSGPEDATPIEAKRTQISASEAAPSGGFVVSADTVWLLEIAGAGNTPGVGDAIIDGEGTVWTLLRVEASRSSGVARCHARNLAIRHGLEHRVDIQEATLVDSGSSLDAEKWTTVRAAVPARIQPSETIVGNDTGSLGSRSCFRVYLVDDIQLDHRHRLIDPQGRIYTVDKYIQSERIDTLAIAEVSLVEITLA